MTEQSTYPEIDRSLEQEPGGASVENPLLLVHRLLRDRYPLAIGLGVVMAVGGGVVGRLAMAPKYASEGMIQIVPAIPKVLYDSEESQVPPLFESFVAAQAQFVTTRRVLDMAMQDEKLRATAWPEGVEGLKRLQRSVKTIVPSKSQIVRVQSETTDPALAQVSLNAVMRAYKRLYIDERGRSRDERQRILEEQQGTLQAELRSVKDQINSLAEEFGVDNLARLHAARVDEMEALDGKIRDVDLAIAEQETRAGLRSSAERTASAQDGPASLPDPIAEREALEAALAQRDETLANDLAQERDLKGELADLRNAGYGPQHRGVKRLTTRMTGLRIRIDDRVATLGENIDIGKTGDVIAGASIEDLRALRARYQRLRDGVQSQASFLAKRRSVIAGLQDEARNKDKLLADARTALDQLNLERRQQDEATGRVSIASWGDYPVTPSKDKRIPAAVAGVLGGFGVGVGLIALLGLFRQSCRYVDDLEHPMQSAPLLGTLPNLDQDDPEQDELAALSVHQIRNVLELQHDRKDGLGRAFTITSACAGEGKTSLAMALGMSFAAAGERTLIMDADLIGRGVTTQLTLDGKPGMREFLEGESVDRCAHATPVANLCAMPTGSMEGFEPKNLSRERSVRILADLRGAYDVILIDTGPLLGSLEGNLLCALSDASVLVVTRGQKSKLVQASLARLANIGGRCAGMVFNRALADDYIRSVSHASFHVASVRSSHQPITTDDSIVGARALVQAVAGVGRERGEQGRV